MAHWHDFNPWAAKLVYMPDLGELSHCVVTGRRLVMLSHWRSYGPKLDAYLLKDPIGYHIGLRYGPEGSKYLSPLADQQATAKLWKKYAPKEPGK